MKKVDNNAYFYPIFLRGFKNFNFKKGHNVFYSLWSANIPISSLYFPGMWHHFTFVGAWHIFLQNNHGIKTVKVTRNYDDVIGLDLVKLAKIPSYWLPLTSCHFVLDLYG